MAAVAAEAEAARVGARAASRDQATTDATENGIRSQAVDQVYLPSAEEVLDLTPAGAACKRKWGQYPPSRRGNVDQVPLPFVNGMDITYEETGATRVAINQLGPALSKRMCTGQLCVRAEPPKPPAGANAAALALYKQKLMEQPPPCLLFRGTGARITQAERDAYPPELVVLWQP